MIRTATKVSREKWASLHYPIELRELPAEQGGGWIATIPTLGDRYFIADGASPAEAIYNLEQLRLDSYDLVTEGDQPVPLPPDASDRLPSGQFVQRINKLLHKELRDAAARYGVSLNAYCAECLLRGHLLRDVREAVDATGRELIATARTQADQAARQAAREEVNRLPAAPANR